MTEIKFDDKSLITLQEISQKIDQELKNAEVCYKHMDKMNKQSYIRANGQDLGFMKGYWIGLLAAKKVVDDKIRSINTIEHIKSKLGDDSFDGKPDD